MVDKNTPGDKKLSVPSKTLTLKPRVETGTVRQSFPHGRTKQVVVEKRGKRRVGGDGQGPEAPHTAPEPVAAKAAPAAGKPQLARAAAHAPPAQSRNASGVVLRTLTEDEHAARVSALADARLRDQEERRQAELEAKKRFGEAETARAPAAAAAAAPAARTLAPTSRAPALTPAGRPPSVAAEAEEDEGPRLIRRGPGGAMRPVAAPKTTHKPAPQKQRGRLTLVTALN